MNNSRKRLLISFILNIIMIILFISSIIIEIIDIHNNPKSVYQNVWGLFRYFTIDGNLLSCIFNIIMTIKEYQALKLSSEEAINNKILTHFLYIIGLISACNDILIFAVVMFIFIPFSKSEMIFALIGTYKASSVHITIPLILTFRFLFLYRRNRELKLLEKFIGGIPMSIYGITIYILAGAKVFTSYDKKEGDGKIPYPFFDVYHQDWYFCFFIAISIIIFGFGTSFLFNFLNKKLKKCILPIDLEGDIEIRDEREDQNLFIESSEEN